MTSRVTSMSVMIVAVAAVAFIGVLMMGAPQAEATADAAKATKLGCPACHTGAPGRGTLTARGKQYQSTGK